jgi:hypothetical protein
MEPSRSLPKIWLDGSGGRSSQVLSSSEDSSAQLRLHNPDPSFLTLDLQDATTLNLETPPSTAPISIPGPSGEAPLADFNKVVDKSIHPKFKNYKDGPQSLLISDMRPLPFSAGERTTN